MFIDYQLSVFEDYQRKKAGNVISPRLIDPSPAEIREECMAVCEERYTTKDQRLLRTVFGRCDSCSEYVQAINRHETDKFKPLISYLKGKIKNPDIKNVELLAWLIDFEPRPFELGKKYNNTRSEQGGVKVGERGIDPKNEGEQKDNGPKSETEINETEEREEQNEDKPTPDVPQVVVKPSLREESKSSLKIRPVITLTLLILSVGTCFYLLLNPKKLQKTVTGKEGCMYWAGDHYEQVSCNEKFGSDTLLVAFDSVKLNHFKKITEPDTITGKSKGSVWYVKVDQGIEFYTSNGVHPIQMQKRLLPITDYILFKHVHQKTN